MNTGKLLVACYVLAGWSFDTWAQDPLQPSVKRALAPRAAPQEPVVAAKPEAYLLEAYPVRIAASRKRHEAALNRAARDIAAARSDLPQAVIVEAARLWSTDKVVRVAFPRAAGGNEVLYERIADAASEWVRIGGANVRLQFKDQRGRFLTWAPSDVVHAGEIRIAFIAGPAEGGYWSHVGASSVNAQLEGGRPGQASMNFDSFDKALPADWRAVVLHEFGHALGFEHEHQNPSGGCDFRFDDDPDYVRTDRGGYFVNDSAGKRPGLYTKLSGKDNRWSRSKVDANLKALPDTSAFSVGPFDRLSIMKYFFPADMFVSGAMSGCYTSTETASISTQDAIGVRRAYPQTDDDIAALNAKASQAIAALRGAASASVSVKNGAIQQLRLRGSPL